MCAWAWTDLRISWNNRSYAWPASEERGRHSRKNTQKDQTKLGLRVISCHVPCCTVKSYLAPDLDEAPPCPPRSAFASPLQIPQHHWVAAVHDAHAIKTFQTGHTALWYACKPSTPPELMRSGRKVQGAPWQQRQSSPKGAGPLRTSPHLWHPWRAYPRETVTPLERMRPSHRFRNEYDSGSIASAIVELALDSMKHARLAPRSPSVGAAVTVIVLDQPQHSAALKLTQTTLMISQPKTYRSSPVPF